jgi:sarcosine oxidase subunit beta
MHTIVVGGGIIGLASAYSLLQRETEVTLLEKSHLGAGATGMGGGVRTQFSSAANVRLSLESLDVWNDFEAEFGVNIQPRRLGYLLLARQLSTADQLRSDVEMQQELGAPNRDLSPLEAADPCPGLRADAFVGAGYSPDDLFVDANLALQGYANRVRELGGDIRTGVEVCGIQRTGEGGSVTGVRTDEGAILEADVVVNAAGAWASEIAAMAAVDVPVVPQLRRQLLVEPASSYPPLHPLTMDLDSGFVFYPESEATMIVSGQIGPMQTVDPDRYRAQIDLDWTTSVLEGVGGIADYFGAETTTKERIAGVYSKTSDNNPIIEETVPGFVNAVGFSGHGFMHAPATGRMVAELVTEGTQSLVEPSAFSSDRFERSADDERRFI